MAVMARILQGAGWVWIAAGVASQLTGFGELGWFPGVVLIFIGRLLRTQARRTAPPEPVEPLARESMAPAPRPQRAPPSPPPPTPPLREKTRPIEPVVLVGMDGPRDESQPAPAESPTPPAPPLEPGHKPMSSDEMIAAARKRWDRPRN